MQYTGWAILFLVTVWQLFRIFGGPVTDAENPWSLIGRSSIFALLIGYAKPIFLIVLDIATAPYTALMDITMTAEDFTFGGVENALKNGLVLFVSDISGVGAILLTILMIALGWALGGKAGVVTLLTAFTAGPCIQFFHQKIKKALVRT